MTTTPALRVKPDNIIIASPSSPSEVLLLGRGFDLRLDLFAFVSADVAQFKQRIDKKAKTKLSRKPARAGVRRIDQADLFKILHHIADRGRRQWHRQKPREMARSDRLAMRKIAIDDKPEYFPRAFVETGQAVAAKPRWVAG